MTLEANTVLLASPHVRAITTPDGAALLDIHAGTCYSLNPVGAKIWEQIQLHSGGIGIESIMQHIEQICSVRRQDIQEDVLTYIQDLRLRQLVICASNGHGCHKQ